MRTVDSLHETKDRRVLEIVRNAAILPRAETQPLWRTVCQRWLKLAVTEPQGSERGSCIGPAGAL